MKIECRHCGALYQPGTPCKCGGLRNAHLTSLNQEIQKQIELLDGWAIAPPVEALLKLFAQKIKELEK